MGAGADAVIHVSDGLIADGMDYALRVEQGLLAAGLTTMRHDFTDLRADVPTAALHVLTGGATSVNADVPWMRRALDVTAGLVQQASSRAMSLVGICLGAQLLAEAIRPGSLVSAPSIEVGLALVQRPGIDSSQIAVPAFHYECVAPAFADVPGVDVEWRNEHSAIQSFRFGDRIRGHQFHPELSAADLHRLIDHNADDIQRYGGRVETAHESVDRNAPALPPDLFPTMVAGAAPAPRTPTA